MSHTPADFPSDTLAAEPTEKGQVGRVALWRLVRQVWFAPTARRHFFTKKAACLAEARARIKIKYPPERAEYDERGQCVDKGWCWMDLPRSDVLLKRYARVIFRSLPNV